jgi:hypothetical protein
MGFIDRVKSLFRNVDLAAETEGPRPYPRFRVRATGETVEGLRLESPLCASFGGEGYQLEPGDVLVDLGADGVRVLRADEVE